MSTIILASLVTIRIASTSWANVVQKRMLHADRFSPLTLFAIEWGWMTLLTIPWWLSTLSLGSAFWFWMLLTCLLEVPGNVMLLRSLRSTELSIFGPLASMKPAISLLLSFVLFAEVPSGIGILGVVVVLLGSAILTSEPRDGDNRRIGNAERYAGIRDRLLSTVMTATASVFLKQSLELASQWQALAAWCVLGWLLAILWIAIEKLGRWFHHRRINRQDDPLQSSAAPPQLVVQQSHSQGSLATFYVAIGLLIMQGCTIALFARMNVGYALALFQIGSLVSVLIGHRLFGEAHLARRLIAATIMMLGAIIIIVAG